jgi:MFS family permease
MAIGFIIPIFALFFIDVHGFNEGLIGVIIGISGGIMTLFSGPSGYLADRWGRRPLMIAGLPLMVFGTILLGLATTLFSAALIFWIRSVGMGLYMPSFRSLQADVVLPHERGAIFGKTQTWFNIGAVFGPIIGTFIYELMSGKIIEFGWMSFAGEAVPFFLTGFFHVLMMIVVFRLRFPSPILSPTIQDLSSYSSKDQATQG